MTQENMQGVGPFQGPPKTMFFLGLFVGVAACTTLALIFVIWSIVSGKGLKIGSTGTQQEVAAAPLAPQPSAGDTQQPTTAQPVKAVDNATEHIRGPMNAKVTLIVYSDFECPFCKQHFSTINQLMAAYPKDLRFVYRHYPLSFHQNAEKEAEASECAAELGGNAAFWKFYDKVFTETTSNGTGFALDRLVPAAQEIGLNGPAFKKCLDSGKYAAKVAQEEQEGADAGVQGTPGSFVNGKAISGAQPVAVFKAAIDAALK